MKTTKKLTYSALFSALSVVILLLASLLQIADIAVSMVASAIVMLALVELGDRYAVMIYFATSFLSLAFLPNKFIAAVYLAFTGLYPIIKRFFDARGKLLALFLKAVYFNGALTVALLAAKYLFAIEVYAGWMLVLYYVTANTAFLLFDILLRRMTIVYMTRWRGKTKRFFK